MFIISKVEAENQELGRGFFFGGGGGYLITRLTDSGSGACQGWILLERFALYGLSKRRNEMSIYKSAVS
jgi:hypothetical protein